MTIANPMLRFCMQHMVSISHVTIRYLPATLENSFSLQMLRLWHSGGYFLCYFLYQTSTKGEYCELCCNLIGSQFMLCESFIYRTFSLCLTFKPSRPTFSFLMLIYFMKKSFDVLSDLLSFYYLPPFVDIP